MKTKWITRGILQDRFVLFYKHTRELDQLALCKELSYRMRDRVTRYVNKFVLCFMSYGSYKDSNSKSDLQGHSRTLAVAIR